MRVKNLSLIRVFIFIGISLLFSQKISHMNGVYDLDGDQMLEFIALELDPSESVFPEKVNAGRIAVGKREFSIGKNPNPINIKFTGKDTFDD